MSRGTCKEGNMLILEDRWGNQLLDVIKGDENDLISNETYHPLAGALVIVKSPAGFMLLKNKYRKAWEIVGGHIEPGETPRECAVRECYEESGYEIEMSDLRFIGIMKSFLVAGHFSREARIDFSALYCADIEEVQDFKENDEMTDLCWYNTGNILEDASEIDIKLLEFHV